MFIQINKSSDWDLGAEVAAHLLEIDTEGKVLRLIQVDGVDHIIDLSPSEQNPYEAIDYPPLSMESDWSEWEISPAKFEAYWNREINLRTTELSLSPCSSHLERELNKNMTVIDTIVSKLKKYPDISYETDNGAIDIHPATDDGFLVWLTVSDQELTVGFEGWHVHFQLEEEEDALNLFALGLSEDCRLKVSCRGATEYKWTAEMKGDGGWIQIGTTGLMFYPFWKKRREQYLANKYIKSDSEQGQNGAG